MPAKLALEGYRFGRLTVVAVAPVRRSHPRSWICRCDCGEHTVVTTGHLRERGGHTESCGCLQRERTANCNTTLRRGLVHGHTRFGGYRSRTYHSWEAMKGRCLDPGNVSYHHYGGRGITICAAWVDSFEQFLADMGERPPGRTLDRIDVDGNYEPSNCRWATPQEQMANTRRAKAK